MKPPFCSVLAACGLWLACALTAHSQAYFYSTAAGLADQSGTADGTNATARFNNPGGVAVDSAGNVYVADTGNHAIRLLTPSNQAWVVTTIAGLPGPDNAGWADGYGSSARFNFPNGVAVDKAGNVYVADTDNHVIRQLTLWGTDWYVTTLAGSPGNSGSADGYGSSAQFYFPYGLTVDSAGNVYVADTYNHTIRQVTPSGQVTTLAGAAGYYNHLDGVNTNASFNYPCGITADAAGNLYVADTYNQLIRRVAPVGSDWVVTSLAGIGLHPGSTDGTNRAAWFRYPFGIAADSATNLYVADTLNSTIRKVMPAGTNWVVSTIGGAAGVFDSADGLGSAAQFNELYGVAIDGAGNLYVADTFNDTIRLGQLRFALQAAQAAGKLVLSWPLQATNYTLETRTSLAPGVPWTPLTTGIYTSANNFVRTNTVAGNAGYYRLHHQ